MVSAKTLKGYDLTTIEDYFNVILESKINGQILQTKKQFAKLSKEQKKDFLFWLTRDSEVYNFFLQLF